MATTATTFSERLLIDAGIEPGMTVLDVGCGTGQVSFLLAELVGPDGLVIGVDRDSIAINTAQDRVHLNSVANARFDRMDLTDRLPNFGAIDAIVGRHILSYLSNPVNVTTRLTSFLRPGGLVVFEEHDASVRPGRVQPMPLHEMTQNMLDEATKREGGDLETGFRVPSMLSEANLETEHVRAEAAISGHGEYPSLAASVRTRLPQIVELGVAREEDIDCDLLEQRLADERAETNSVFVSAMVVGVCARKPMIV